MRRFGGGGGASRGLAREVAPERAGPHQDGAAPLLNQFDARDINAVSFKCVGRRWRSGWPSPKRSPAYVSGFISCNISLLLRDLTERGPSDQADDEDEVSRRASLSVLGYHSVKHCIEARPSSTSTTCETPTPRASSPRAPSSAPIPTTGAGVRGRESVCAPSLRVLCARLTRALPQATLVLLGRRPSCVHSMSHDVRGARSRLRLGGFAGGSGKTQLFGL